MERKHWIDNLRWATVLLVLFYHVVYFYNNKGVFGGIGGFGEYPQCKQYQDVVLYILYPWFMPLLCLGLLLIRTFDRKDRFYIFCGNSNYLVIILLCILFWVGEQTLIKHPRPESLDGLLNLYKPVFYLIPFLLGYFVFAHDEVQDKLEKAWVPLMACAIVAGTVLVVTTFGQDYTSPQYLVSPLNCLYGWLMCLAMTGWFKAKFNHTGSFAGYMTRNSFGVYVLHYLVIVALGYMMKHYTSLAPWMIYAILFVAVMTIPFALNEIIKRIPFIRWCVLGIKKKKA